MPDIEVKEELQTDNGNEFQTVEASELKAHLLLAARRTF